MLFYSKRETVGSLLISYLLLRVLLLKNVKYAVKVVWCLISMFKNFESFVIFDYCHKVAVVAWQIQRCFARSAIVGLWEMTNLYFSSKNIEFQESTCTVFCSVPPCKNTGTTVPTSASWYQRIPSVVQIWCPVLRPDLYNMFHESACTWCTFLYNSDIVS